MLQTLWAFVGSLLRWPDGMIVKSGNSLRTAELLCDESGALLFDETGALLTDA